MGSEQFTNLRTITARDFEALRPHLAAWDQLAWAAPQGMAFLLPSWIEASLRHELAPGESWICCFAYAGNDLVGVLPVIISPHRVLGRRGSLLRTGSNRQTRSGDIVLAHDHAFPALQALLKEVRRQIPGHLGLDLAAVRQNSSVWTALKDGVDGYISLRGSRNRYSFLDVSGNFDTYLKGVGKMRRNVRTGRKKLEGRGSVSVEIRTGTEARPEFLPEFLALEASGWKGRKGTAILNNPNKLAFYKALVDRLAAEGRLEWHLIRVDNCLVAAGLGVRCGASLMLPKYAYNEDYSECMPGHLLTEEVFRDAFSRVEIAEINHMSNSTSDRLWHMPQDEYVDLHLVRQSVLAIMIRLPSLIAHKAYESHLRRSGRGSVASGAGRH